MVIELCRKGVKWHSPSSNDAGKFLKPLIRAESNRWFGVVITFRNNLCNFLTCWKLRYNDEPGALITSVVFATLTDYISLHEKRARR